MSDLREDPSPEAAFLRELVRAEEADLPSSDKMNELVARLAPMISKPPAAAFSAKRALSTAIVVMVAAGTWLATSDAGTGHETASSPPPVASVATEAEATEAMVAIAADSAERCLRRSGRASLSPRRHFRRSTSQTCRPGRPPRDRLMSVCHRRMAARTKWRSSTRPAPRSVRATPTVPCR